jgi:uncharacterized protein (DUF983 family)
MIRKPTRIKAMPPVQSPQRDEPQAIKLEEPPRPGSVCPRCQSGSLDYNGLLDLECPTCGLILSSGAGCT